MSTPVTKKPAETKKSKSKKLKIEIEATEPAEHPDTFSHCIDFMDPSGMWIYNTVGEFEDFGLSNPIAYATPEEAYKVFDAIDSVLEGRDLYAAVFTVRCEKGVKSTRKLKSVQEELDFIEELFTAEDSDSE